MRIISNLIVICALVASAAAWADANANLQWGPCKGAAAGDSEYQCAKLTVPLDYNNPHPGNTWIEVIKYQQLGTPANNILFFQGGGPWAAGTMILPEMVKILNIANPAILQHFTLVSFDPRGVGQSQNLSCNAPIIKSFANINYASVAGMNKAIKGYSEMAQECAGQFNGFQNYMGTKYVAEDVDQIRQALGVDKMTYLGYSYGTQLGSLYLSMYPQHIRTMVLDSSITPVHDFQYFIMQSAQAEENTLQAFFSYCDANKECPAYPNAEQAYDQAVAILKTHPVPANPEPLTLAHFYLTVTGMVLGNTSADAQSITPSAWAIFAQGLKQIDDSNDGSIIESLYKQQKDATMMTSIIGAAVVCSDFGNHPDNIQIQQMMTQLRRRTPRIGAYFAGFSLAWCRAFPSEANTLPNRTYPNNTPPTMIIGNFDDPATPYLYAEQMQQIIPNSTLLTWAGPGHITYLGNEMPGTCIQKQVDDFLLNQTPISQPICNDIINPTSLLMNKAQ